MQISDVYVIRDKGLRFVAIVNLPEPMPHEKLMAAWSYAVAYSAKGLNMPDVWAAVKLMQERHPSWRITPVSIIRVGYNPRIMDKDVPD